jgi:hypothetical protein
MAQYKKDIQNSDEFIATQRKNVVVLTESQRDEIKAILLEANNYYNGLFCVVSEDICGMDGTFGKSSLTIIFRPPVITLSTKDERSNAMLNKKGTERLRKWFQTIGMKTY